MEREALIKLAEAFDAARILANAFGEETPAHSFHAYGDASNGLVKTLALIWDTSEGEAELLQYHTMIESGMTVTQALDYVEEHGTADILGY